MWNSTKRWVGALLAAIFLLPSCMAAQPDPLPESGEDSVIQEEGPPADGESAPSPEQRDEDSGHAARHWFDLDGDGQEECLVVAGNRLEVYREEQLVASGDLPLYAYHISTVYLAEDEEGQPCIVQHSATKFQGTQYTQYYLEYALEDGQLVCAGTLDFLYDAGGKEPYPPIPYTLGKEIMAYDIYGGK